MLITACGTAMAYSGDNLRISLRAIYVQAATSVAYVSPTALECLPNPAL